MNIEYKGKNVAIASVSYIQLVRLGIVTLNEH